MCGGLPDGIDGDIGGDVDGDVDGVIDGVGGVDRMLIVYLFVF